MKGKGCATTILEAVPPDADSGTPRMLAGHQTLHKVGLEEMLTASSIFVQTTNERMLSRPGIYIQYTVMPFKLYNAPAIFEHFMMRSAVVPCQWAASTGQTLQALKKAFTHQIYSSARQPPDSVCYQVQSGYSGHLFAAGLG